METKERLVADPDRVAFYIKKLTGENSHFHGSLTLKFHDGKIVNIHSDESMNLHMFKSDEDYE